MKPKFSGNFKNINNFKFEINPASLGKFLAEAANPTNDISGVPPAPAAATQIQSTGARPAPILVPAAASSSSSSSTGRIPNDVSGSPQYHQYYPRLPQTAAIPTSPAVPSAPPPTPASPAHLASVYEEKLARAADAETAKDREISELKAALVKAKEETEQARREAEQAKKELAKEREQFKKERDDLQTESLDTLARTANPLIAELNKFRAENMRLNQQLTENMANQQELHQQIRVHQAAVATRVQENRELYSQLTALQTQHAQLDSAYITAQNNIFNLEQILVKHGFQFVRPYQLVTNLSPNGLSHTDRFFTPVTRVSAAAWAPTHASASSTPLSSPRQGASVPASSPSAPAADVPGSGGAAPAASGTELPRQGTP